MLFILTSNVAAEYDEELAKRYKASLDTFIGPTETFISENTLQVSNYEKYNWTLFNPEEKRNDAKRYSRRSARQYLSWAHPCSANSTLSSF